MGGVGCGSLFEAGRLFEVDANSRRGAYSNKYDMLVVECEDSICDYFFRDQKKFLFSDTVLTMPNLLF